MLEQRHQLRRREVACRRAEHEIEKGAGHGARDRHAGRIVDDEIVALEPRRHAPREHPVRRDQRRGLARRLDRRRAGSSAMASASSWAVGVSSVCRPASALASSRRRAVIASQERLPAVRARRPGAAPRSTKPSRAAARSLGLAARHIGDLVARRAELAQAAPPCRLADARDARQARPAFIVEGEIEARQHHGAVRQRGDHLQEPRRGRHRAGRAGGDHRSRRRSGKRAARPRTPSAHCGARSATRARCSAR